MGDTFGIISLKGTGGGGGGGGVFTSDIVVSLSGGKTAGKYTNGQTIPAIGKTAEEVFNDIFQETLFPALTAPSVGAVTITPSAIQEVGVLIASLQIGATFSRGSINPQYSAASPFRSGLPNTHIFTGSGGMAGSSASVSLTPSKTITNYTVVNGANTFGIQVAYDAGVQPKDSSGANFNTPLAAGNSNTSQATIVGQLPYFFGKVTTGVRPTANQTLINSGTKVVADSNGTLTVNFNSGSGDFLWFAIPDASTSKSAWYEGPTNNGAIGGLVLSGGNLFPDFDSVSINSPSSLWSSQMYKIYVSNYQTSSIVNMQLRNP